MRALTLLLILLAHVTATNHNKKVLVLHGGEMHKHDMIDIMCKNDLITSEAYTFEFVQGTIGVSNPADECEKRLFHKECKLNFCDPDFDKEANELLDTYIEGDQYNDYIGILGFSEGAAAALTYMAQLKSNSKSQIQFIILVDGYMPGRTVVGNPVATGTFNRNLKTIIIQAHNGKFGNMGRQMNQPLKEKCARSLFTCSVTLVNLMDKDHDFVLSNQSKQLLQLNETQRTQPCISQCYASETTKGTEPKTTNSTTPQPTTVAAQTHTTQSKPESENNTNLVLVIAFSSAAGILLGGTLLFFACKQQSTQNTNALYTQMTNLHM